MDFVLDSNALINRNHIAVGQDAREKTTTVSYDRGVIESLEDSVWVPAVVSTASSDERVLSGRLNHLYVGEKQSIEPKTMNIIERIKLN